MTKAFIKEENKMTQTEIRVKSSIDGTEQPSLFFPAKEKGRPLLVGLHTWSFDRFNQVVRMPPYAEELDFNLLLPEFRGPNTVKNPKCTEACGSELAIADIKDAIDYVMATEDIDKENIFLLGQSGGGHMALLVAGHFPEYFKAIGAYVPITDLEKWAEQNAGYRGSVLACCSNSVEEMRKRSPMTYIERIATANLKIFHGKYDHVVPVEQSMELYRAIYEHSPSARVFFEIFDGGHEIDMQAAMYWFTTQYKKKKLDTVTG